MNVNAISLRRPTRADASRYFTPEEIEKSRAYQRPKQRVDLVDTLIGLVLLLAIIGAGSARWLLDRLSVPSWPLQLAVVIAAIMVVMSIVSLPFGIWRVFTHEAKWGFNKRTVGTFVADEIKEPLVSIVLFSALLIPVWALIRATSMWWLWGALTITAFTAVMTLLYPIVILPISNKLTPLQDEALAVRLRALAEHAGVSIGGFFVMDASKRDTKDNAFVSGFGRTRRVVIFDTMLDLPHDGIEAVVAHEIGHWRKGHLRLRVFTGILQFPIALGIIAALTSLSAVRDFAGIETLGDPAALPLFMVAGGIALTLTSGGNAWVSRWHEREADLESLDLIEDPGSFSRVMRSFVGRNLPDIDPSWWKRVRADHPPIVERLAFADAWVAQRGTNTGTASPDHA